MKGTRRERRSSVLPLTCGEETDLPGIPAVGCVASVSCNLDQPGGFSACITASDAVYVLGPNLDIWPEHVLYTRLLWRPPALVATVVGGDNGLAEERDIRRVPSSTFANGDNPTELTGTRLSNLVAFRLHPNFEEDDLVGICVAWTDALGNHHLTFLQLSLRLALQPSVRPVDMGLRLVVDAIPLPRQVGVLRLFYHSDLAQQQPTSSAGATSGEEVTSHVVLCSCYETSGEGRRTGTNASLGELPSSAPRRQTDKRPERGRRTNAGKLLYLVVHVAPGVPAACEPAAEQHIAPWLRNFQPERIITAFSVQGRHSKTTAAAGSVDGRVYALHATDSTVLHRCSGPVADLCFVSTSPTSSDPSARSAAVDTLLQTVRAEAGLTNCAAHSGEQDGTVVSLIVLDSVGSIIVLPSINATATSSPLVVPDIPQMITLVCQQKPMIQIVNSPGSSSPTAVSPKQFYGIGSLRQLFPKGMKKTPLAESAVSMCSHTPVLSSATLTSISGSFSLRSSDESSRAGNLLSRGLLCIANVEGRWGLTELVVSTLDQVVLSIPYEPTERGFAINEFVVTPTPMHYVGFVDFFGTGSPDMVLGGFHTVLVARSSRTIIREKARLLMRLLSRRGVARLMQAESEELLET